MDEPRVWPNFAPRLGKDVTIIFGEPINPTIEPHNIQYRNQYPGGWRPATYERPVGADLEDEPKELATMRSAMAETLRRELMRLGDRVNEVEKKPPGRLVGW